MNGRTDEISSKQIQKHKKKTQIQTDKQNQTDKHTHRQTDRQRVWFFVQSYLRTWHNVFLLIYLFLTDLIYILINIKMYTYCHVKKDIVFTKRRKTFIDMTCKKSLL